MDGHSKQGKGEPQLLCGTDGQPIIINGLRIDTAIFSQGFVDACVIPTCGGECCYTGVWADVKEKDTILNRQDIVLQYMDETQNRDVSQWFEKEIVEDPDFESGLCIGTEVYNGKCVFQMKNGFCVIQYAAIETGMYPWEFKPKYCVMFPIVVSEGVPTYDDDHSGEMHHCGINCHQNHRRPVFESCAAEIEYAVGKEGFELLTKHYETHKNTYRATFEQVKREGMLTTISIPIQKDQE